jgi:hypothetical protein
MVRFIQNYSLIISRKTCIIMKNLSVAAQLDARCKKRKKCSLASFVLCIGSTGGRWKKRARSPAQRALFPLFAPGNTMAAALYELSGEMHCRKVTHMKITQGEVGRECI